jgi:adhesin/invasin
MITGFRLSRVALGVLVVTAIACQRVALLAPAGSTITLTSLATTLPLNGTTSLIAQVVEPAGTPPQRGTLVSFTTSLGAIQPIEAETDAGGRVLVTFKAGTLSGTATIVAVSGGVTTGATGAIKIAIGSAAASAILVTANPSNISGGGQSIITAVVNDAGGTPLASVPVTFSTDGGSVSPGVATTDASGVATTTLTTNKTAKVTATAGVASTSGTTTTPAPSGSVTVNVNPVPTVTISSTTPNPTQKLPVTFSIAATPATGNAITSIVVNYGDGKEDPLQGNATSAQHVYDDPSTFPNTFRVTATATDNLGGKGVGSTVVFVQTQAPIVSLTFTSSPGTLAGTTAVNFTATVTPSGTSVAQYVWNFGDGQSQTTTGSGANQVSHTYITTSLPKTASVTITTTTNQTASASTTVTP